MPILNIWDLLMIIGIAQGMIMAFVFWFKRNTHISAKFLGIIFFTLAFSTLGTLISEKPADPVSSFHIWLMRYVPFWPFMLVGPSLLFLVQSQVDRSFKFNRRKKIHYLAALYSLIPTVAWISAWIRYKLDWVQYDKPKFLEFIDVFYTQGDIAYWLHLLIYTFLTRKYMRRNRAKKADKLYQLITAFQLFLIAWFPFLVLYVSPYDEVLDPLSYYPVFIPIAILTYWLGFQWFFYLDRSKSSSISEDVDMKSISGILNKAMTDGLFLDPDLTVRIAGKKLGIPQRVLSQFVNQHLNKSFNDYVNNYRVDEVKRKLADQSYERLTIAAIAHDSGFKSIATFQRAFKKMVGISPLAYKNQLKSNPQITI